jgi:hypothetical protein
LAPVTGTNYSATVVKRFSSLLSCQQLFDKIAHSSKCFSTWPLAWRALLVCLLPLVAHSRASWLFFSNLPDLFMLEYPQALSLFSFCVVPLVMLYYLMDLNIVYTLMTPEFITLAGTFVLKIQTPISAFYPRFPLGFSNLRYLRLNSK